MGPQLQFQYSELLSCEIQDQALISILRRPTDIENRIYREEFTGKKCKTAILLYCFHTAGVLHIFMPYNLTI